MYFVCIKIRRSDLARLANIGARTLRVADEILAKFGLKWIPESAESIKTSKIIQENYLKNIRGITPETITE